MCSIERSRSEFPMRTPEYLRNLAEKCRRLASQLTNEPVADQLAQLAAEYEAQADTNQLQMQAGDEPDDEQGSRRAECEKPAELPRRSWQP